MTSRTRERMSEEECVNPCDPSSSDPPRPEQERTAAVRQAVETLSAMPWDVLRRWRGGRGTAKPRPEEAQRTVRERDSFRVLSYWNWIKAASRGPDALLRRFLRIQGYRLVNKVVGRSPRRRRR